MWPSPDSSTHYTLGIIEAPEHATEMTHSRVKTTPKFLQCTYLEIMLIFVYTCMYLFLLSAATLCISLWKRSYSVARWF